MRDGKTLLDMYQFVVEYVQEQKPDLEKHFAKNLVSGVRLHRALLCEIRGS